jgi:hypothetical protein
MSMEDIFSDTKPEPVQETVVETKVVEPAPVEAAPVVEVAPIVETPTEPIDETTGMTPKEKAFYTKSKDETRKRQELERELAEWKAKVNQPIQQTQPVEQPKEFWEDPEGTLNRYKEEMNRMTIDARLNTAEMIAKTKYQDYDENLNVFAEIMQKTPGLQQQMLNAPDPAEFAYRTGKNYSDLQKAGNLDTLRAQIEQETRIKIETEFKMREEAKKQALDAIPQSLTNVRSTGANKPVWSGPPPLDDILH